MGCESKFATDVVSSLTTDWEIWWRKLLSRKQVWQRNRSSSSHLRVSLERLMSLTGGPETSWRHCIVLVVVVITAESVPSVLLAEGGDICQSIVG